MPDFTLASPLTMTIGGEAVPTKAALDVINPSTGAPFGQMPDATPDQVDVAFNAAAEAFPHWRRDEGLRRKTLHAMADAIAASADDIAPILTAEQGKPLSRAHLELNFALAWLRYYGDLETPEQILRDDAEARVSVQHRPLGVVAAIAPFNFPVSTGLAKVATAMRAGNTVVLKPSPYTPLATLKVGEILRSVVPAGVFNILTGRDELGPMMTTHPLTRGITFTGSTATGQRIAAAAANELTRMTLELGGNDAAIVLDDVDPELVATELFDRAFNNTGQVCIAPKRVYVPRGLRQALVDTFADKARSAKVSDGFLPDTEYGPLNNIRQFQRVVELVDDALAHGAKVAAGGRAIEGPGYFHELTILTDVTDGVRIVDEEQFGPALPIVEYSDVDDAVRRANAGKLGLASSVWSADPERAGAVAEQLDAGTTWVNAHSGVSPAYPFGGVKWSGLGTEGGPWGLDGLSDVKILNWNKSAVVRRS